MKPSNIFHRTKPVKHMEVHYLTHIEFWSYEDKQIHKRSLVLETVCWERGNHNDSLLN